MRGTRQAEKKSRRKARPQILQTDRWCPRDPGRGKDRIRDVPWNIAHEWICSHLPAPSACFDDRSCSSGACVLGKCVDERLEDIELCDSDMDCGNKFCGRKVRWCRVQKVVSFIFFLFAITFFYNKYLKVFILINSLSYRCCQHRNVRHLSFSYRFIFFY